MMQIANSVKPFATVGSDEDISKQERDASTALVSAMYGKSGCDSLEGPAAPELVNDLVCDFLVMPITHAY